MHIKTTAGERIIWKIDRWIDSVLNHTGGRKIFHRNGLSKALIAPDLYKGGGVVVFDFLETPHREAI